MQADHPRFETAANAPASLTSELFTKGVAGDPGPLLQAHPEVRVYETA